MLVFLVLLALAYMGHSQCSGSTPYHEPNSNQCYAQCPWQSPKYYYLYPPSNNCFEVCPSSYYGYDGNRTCLSTCPSSPIQTYYDTVNRRCVNHCPSNYFAYLGSNSANNQKCLANCVSGTYADHITGDCVVTCPIDTYYMDGSQPNCTVRCPDNYYGSPTDRKCKAGGSCPTSPVEYFSDDTNNMCVQQCSNNTFADSNTGRCLIYCSSGYYADDSSGVGVCVATCPATYYRDAITRRCVLSCPEGTFIDDSTLNCVATCPSGTYGDKSTGKCQSTCTNPTYGDPQVSQCVTICSIGLYADNDTHLCVTALNCYGNTVGDPTTHKCVNITDCSTNPYYYANLVSKVCTTICPSGLWGDKSTKTCVSTCPWSPGTYVSWKNPTTRECLTQCPLHPFLYADNLTQTCVSTCPQAPSVEYDTYADYTTRECVRVCPNDFFGDLANAVCVANCPTTPTLLFYHDNNGSCIQNCPQQYYADPSMQICVTECPSTPEYYAYDPTNYCIDTCPDGYFADASTRKCVEACPQTTSQYGDVSTNKCVDKCPMIPDLYGQDLNDGNKTCVLQCQQGHYADPETRTCVKVCNMTNGYYGDTSTRRCVLECTLGTFSDNTTGLCVSTCPRKPSYFYGNPVNKHCVERCPQFLYANNDTNLCVQPSSCQTGYYADDSSNYCVALCPPQQFTFGETSTRRCVKACQEGQFADNTTRKCSASCNTTARLYKEPSTKTCVYTCPSIPNFYADPLTMTCVAACTGGYYAFDDERKCVSICPSTPERYADYNTDRCVASCPRQYYAFVDNSQRGCVAHCPQRVYSPTNIVDMFADNSTWTCVPQCPQSQHLYNFKHPSNTNIRTCQLTCPMVGTTYYFAENVTQSCVTQCPSLTYLTYGDVFTSKCQSQCTRDQFRDNTTKRCTYSCSAGYFSDNTTWNCVTVCPSFYYGYSGNNTCLKECPTGFYAENATRTCKADCQHRWYYWGDDTVAECVTSCPQLPNLFTNPDTKTCEHACTGGLFGDDYTGRCVPALACTQNFIGETNTHKCVEVCPIQVPSFHNNDTNECVEICPSGYADNSTMICVEKCPSIPDFYGYTHPTKGPLCVYYCPANHYRYSVTRHCLQNCPAPDYFKDTLTMTCVTTCPDHYYADSNGQICVLDCGVSNKFALRADGVCVNACPDPLYADSTTNWCVQVCPFGYFGENNVCVATCVDGFADPITKVCQQNCSEGYYAKAPQQQCRISCEPQFALDPDRTCVSVCPGSNDTSVNLYADPTSDKCINQCLPGWYADNDTRTCTQTCSGSLFADNSTGLCVDKCPSTPDYYGYNRVCYFPCPCTSGTCPNLFAENTTRECMSLCPTNSFADSFNRRCMDVCTGTKYAYDNPSNLENTCVEMCPHGFYGSSATKSCVTVCPEGTYGENVTNVCMENCPDGTFADDHLNLCVAACNDTRQEFADPSTHRCVKVCPQVPSLYAQTTPTRSCVITCQSGYYRLNTTRVCSTTCPQPLFADPVTANCVYKCQIDFNYYADNSTRTCASSCPNVTGTITYADDSTKRCVLQCPFFPRLYGNNQTNKCVGTCPSGTYGDNDTRICHDICFFGANVGPTGGQKYTFADPNSHFCVQVCPKEWFADNATVTCTQDCTLGTFSDNSTWTCVAVCPVNPLSFAYRPTKQCRYECPSPLFGNEDGRDCVDVCPTTPFYYYMDQQRNRCVSNCTFPYFADRTTQKCETSCQFGYFQNLADHTCEKCPESCLSCVAALNCTACQPNLYMFDGECIESCPQFPIRYFANDLSSNCVENCIPPYFGFEVTGKCEDQCPATYYSDSNTNQCQSCPTGCEHCLETACSSCLSGYVHVAAFSSCSQVCNSTHNYFINGQCALSCTDGTFLLSDLVTCQACNDNCLTCQNIGTNCTKCANSFWYNYVCVEKCPNDFYVDSDYKCQPCINQGVNSCVLPPLTFTVTTYVVNYQLYADIKFNRAVQLTLVRFKAIMRIRSTKQSIKANRYEVTTTDSITYTMHFYNSSSLNQQSLQFGFLPGTITDENNNPLTVTSYTAQISSIEAVDEATIEQTETIKNNVNVVGWILVAVILLMMVKFSYPLLILVDAIQLLFMHNFLLLVPLPYLWYNVNSVLSFSHFAFLPKLYTQDTTASKQPYSGFITDTTMLGNLQPFVFIFCIFGFTYFMFWLLSLKKVNCSNGCRKKVKWIFRNRMKLSLLFEAFYYPAFYTIFFAFYQFKGYHANLNAAGANLAMAIIMSLVYLIFFIFLLYVSAKTRDIINTVPEKLMKREDPSKMPKKYSFLVLQRSKFALEIALRMFMKIAFAISLLIENIQVQLILFMVLNLICLLYYLIFKPSLYKVTNRLNIFICVCFLAIEIILFSYTIGQKTSSTQQLVSILCLSVSGLLVIVILLWIIYRFAIYLRESCCDVKYDAQLEVQVKDKKKYKKIQRISEDGSELELEKNQKKYQYQKANSDMNVSELNAEDEEDQEDRSVNPDHLVKEFAYHFIPAKTQGLIKAENRLLGLNENKKKHKPIVIEIDEDQLVKEEGEGREKASRMSNRQKKTGHLRIQQDYNDTLEQIQLQRSPEKKKAKKPEENVVIWGQMQQPQDSEN